MAFCSVHADEEVGGMQLPFAVTACLQSTFTAANCGTCAYPFLTIAAGNMLNSVGTPAQIERYLLPMLEGKVFGTMNLSETQAGSSLGDITTKAVRRDDGTYSISGQKMWISGGDHDLSDNIFHMMLAKVRSDGGSGDTEAGVKGISLFIVPKYRMAHQHRAGERNGVALAGLNHKMGTSWCIL
jgi:butyryl-CoA dehydrogenase